MNEITEKLLKRCVELSKESVASGNNPFGALLADSSGNILIESGNIEVTEKDITGHAETTVAKYAGKKFSKEFLWNTTLYTTAEPCAMCTGAIYWANIGNIVYGIDERQLLELTGSNEKNPTFDLPCRDVIAKGQKEISVVGPVASETLQKEIIEPHIGFWD
ncbi:nucleoside deaminase [Photobacterium satsumensis]|uniref:nucleoside deaminase n=1 Tax=Photobacterium satsumensis TaxID=2910239 RepID=UPI003D122C31